MANLKKNSPGCDCCNTCSICSDYFDRSDNSNVSTGSDCGWTEQSGTWDISSNALVGSASGIITCDTAQPDGNAWQAISVNATHSTSAKFVKLILGWVDSNNYYWAGFKFGSNSIEIHKVAGGADSTLMTGSATLTVNTYYDLGFCCSPAGELSATIGTTIVEAGAQTVTGTTVGLGTDAGNATFLTFAQGKVRDDDNPDCGSCWFCGECTNHEAPDEVLVEISGISNTGNYSGCETLNAAHYVSRAGSCGWYLIYWNVLTNPDFPLWAGYLTVQFGVTSTFGARMLGGSSTSGIGAIHWSKAAMTNPCTTWSSLNIPYSYSNSGVCTSSAGSTFHVTSL